MRIGIIGAGHVGSTLAEHFVRIGHEVVISNSRGPETLADLVERIGGGLRAVTPVEAAEFGQVVAIAVPFAAYRQLPAAQLRDKVVIDATNYYPERDGDDPELQGDDITSSEKIREFTGANVVKAFNAVTAQNLRDRARPKGDPLRLAIPYSGSDEEARAVVAGLIRDMGFDPVDAGNLAIGGRKHQPGRPAYGAELNAAEMSGLLRAE